MWECCYSVEPKSQQTHHPQFTLQSTMPKTIVVTGASRGIGFSTALQLARAGHHVIAAMRNPSASPELAALAGKENLSIQIETMDVDSDQSVTDAFARILAAGPVDVLVNNAGIDRMGAVEELPLAEFRACMETNYFGLIRCSQAVIPSMRQRGSGAIINIASVSGKISVAPMAAYAASKFAVEAFSEALAQELRPFNIRVVIIQPGIIDTYMAHHIGEMEYSKVYPQARRISAMFEASLAAGAGTPELVAAKILEIADSETTQLRHPVGPDAEAFLGWRKSLDDEQWVKWGAQSDADWLKSVKNDFGMDLNLE
jgi:NAD(P)-dependent dehydrogenase (short-subunit alcohol dehydrogenase family)